MTRISFLEFIIAIFYRISLFQFASVKQKINILRTWMRTITNFCQFDFRKQQLFNIIHIPSDVANQFYQFLTSAFSAYKLFTSRTFNSFGVFFWCLTILISNFISDSSIWGLSFHQMISALFISIFLFNERIKYSSGWKS